MMTKNEWKILLEDNDMPSKLLWVVFIVVVLYRQKPHCLSFSWKCCQRSSTLQISDITANLNLGRAWVPALMNEVVQ